MTTKLLLILIVVFGLLIRLIALDQYPNGFSGDEAQQGYSAYSISKTARDEWGQFLPIFPRSSTDFKPPALVYLLVPSVALFGLSIEGVRLAPAMIGTLLILVVYFLSLEIFKEKKVALWSMFLLAISPWYIQLSRTAFEGGPGILFFSLGLLFLLKLKKNWINLIWSSLFFGLSLYTYHSYRLFSPLFISGLFLIREYRAVFLKSKKIIAWLILLIFVLPLALNLGITLTRVSDVGIASNQNITGYFEHKGISPLPRLMDRLFDNKFLYVIRSFTDNYLSYFSPTFLFTGGRSESSYLNFPGFELLYLVETIFVGFALYQLIIRKNSSLKIILLWLLLAPIPASLGAGGMNANRAITFLPIITIISGFGAKSLVDYLNRKFKFNQANSSILIIIILIVNFLFFLRFYFITLPQRPPESIRYGYNQVFEKIIADQDKYNEIVISRAFTQPQIYVAFYGQIDPNYYQQSSQDWLRYEKAGKMYIDQLESWNLGKFKFEDINWSKKDSLRKNALIVSTPNDFPENVQSVLDIYNPKGKLLYRLVATSP